MRGEAAPEKRQHAAVAVARIDAGAPHLDEARQLDELPEVELARRVETTRSRRALRRQDAIRADDGAGRGLAHEQVIAHGVERVLVEARGRAREHGTQLFAEHAVAKPLRRLDVARLARDHDLERAGARITSELVVVRHAAIVRTARRRVERKCIPSFVCA